MEQDIKSVVDKAQLLTEALPYIRDFKSKRIVIKFGSNVFRDRSVLKSVIDDVVLLKLVGMEPIIVHSGSDDINKWLKNIGKDIEFVEDNRVTDSETMEIIEMVLGKLNKDVVQLFAKAGAKAVGICGKDSGTILVTPKKIEGTDIGYFGEIESVNTELIDELIEHDFIPVIASIGVNKDFDSYNLKADDVASAVAKAVVAEKIIFLAQAVGICDDNKDTKAPQAMITVTEAQRLIDEGSVEHELAIKLGYAIDAVKNGVHRTHIVDGSVKHSVLLELFTVYGVGTAIVSDEYMLYQHEKEYRNRH
jgi:acetylglutamate kinase